MCRELVHQQDQQFFSELLHRYQSYSTRLQRRFSTNDITPIHSLTSILTIWVMTRTTASSLCAQCVADCWEMAELRGQRWRGQVLTQVLRSLGLLWDQEWPCLGFWHHYVWLSDWDLSYHPQTHCPLHIVPLQTQWWQTWTGSWLILCSAVLSLWWWSLWGGGVVLHLSSRLWWMPHVPIH